MFEIEIGWRLAIGLWLGVLVAWFYVDARWGTGDALRASRKREEERLGRGDS